jgi:hypothetical protein
VNTGMWDGVFTRSRTGPRINHAGASGCARPALNAQLTVLHH